MFSVSTHEPSVLLLFLSRRGPEPNENRDKISQWSTLLAEQRTRMIYTYMQMRTDIGYATINMHTNILHTYILLMYSYIHAYIHTYGTYVHKYIQHIPYKVFITCCDANNHFNEYNCSNMYLPVTLPSLIRQFDQNTRRVRVLGGHSFAQNTRRT